MRGRDGKRKKGRRRSKGREGEKGKERKEMEGERKAGSPFQSKGR